MPITHASSPPPKGERAHWQKLGSRKLLMIAPQMSKLATVMPSPAKNSCQTRQHNVCMYEAQSVRKTGGAERSGIQAGKTFKRGKHSSGENSSRGSVQIGDYNEPKSRMSSDSKASMLVTASTTLPSAALHLDSSAQAYDVGHEKRASLQRTALERGEHAY